MIEQEFVTSEASRARVRRYNHSRQGLITRRKYFVRNRKRIESYNKVFAKKRMKYAKTKGLCISCLGEKEQPDRACCNACLKRIAQNTKRSKLKKKQEMKL